MLSNFIIIMLALAIPVGAFFSFRAGYCAGRAAGGGRDLPDIAPALRSRKKTAVSPEQARLGRMLANIDSYDGTGEGQLEI